MDKAKMGKTKSGKPSGKTGERYLPASAIKSLSPQEYAATTRAKRRGLLPENSTSNNQRKKIAKKRQLGTARNEHIAFSNG